MKKIYDQLQSLQSVFTLNLKKRALTAICLAALFTAGAVTLYYKSGFQWKDDVSATENMKTAIYKMGKTLSQLAFAPPPPPPPSGPACVDAGIQTWLRVDQGVNIATGTKISSWTDASGNNRTPIQNNNALRPDLLTGNRFNFHPAVEFTGNEVMQFPNPGIPHNNLRIYAVGTRTNNATNWKTLFRGSVRDHQMIVHYSNHRLGYYDNGNGNLKSSNHVVSATVPQLMSFAHTATTNGAVGRLNGKAGTNMTGIDETNAAINYFGNYQGGGQPFGALSEVIVYNGLLSVGEELRIQSYLALKYGLTLDQTTPTNYVASDGSTLMWDATANTGYNNDIAGIGRDNCTNLDQKQSKSVNTDDLVTVAVGSSLATTNALNMGVIANNSFLVWGNNNGTTVINTAVAGFSNTQLRMNRTWKVDKTNWSDQTITLCAVPVGARYLIISPDATFGAGDTELTLEVNPTTSCVTFNSSLLPDGGYFTFGSRLAGPACVDDQVRLWVRADYGLTVTGANVTGWKDFSGRNSHSASVAGAVAYNITPNNFNPSFRIRNATADGILGPNLGMSGSNNFSVFFVTTPTNANNGFDLVSIADGYANAIEYSTSGGGRLGTRANAAGVTTNGLTANINRAHVFGFNASSGSGLGYMDGLAGTAQAPGSIASSTRGWRVGDFLANGDGSGAHYSEVVVYNKALNAAEMQRVNSYLSLKYGITYNNGGSNYVASNGSTIMWSAADNAGYNNDIAGLGRDDCTALHQKQSKSVNTDALITLATGTAVATSNQANTAAVTNNNSYLTWGNNNGATTFLTAVTGLANATLRTARIWKVDKTNWADQSVTLAVGQIGARYLIISSDPTFGAGDTELALDNKGRVTFNSSLLSDGGYFALATKLSGPACVDAGIQTWLRADYGLTAAKVSTWGDFSGSSRSPVQATVAAQPDLLTSTQFNYYPAVRFTGNQIMQFPNPGISHNNLKIFAVGIRSNNTTNWKTMFRGSVQDHQLMGTRWRSAIPTTMR